MQFLEQFHLGDNFPTMMILQHSKGQDGRDRQPERYDFPHASSNVTNAKDIRQFVEDFMNGRASRNLKSDSAAYDGSTKLKTFVGADFQKRVFDSVDTHVLVEFYAPWYESAISLAHKKTLRALYFMYVI
jgi:hypothetical protein